MYKRKQHKKVVQKVNLQWVVIPTVLLGIFTGGIINSANVGNAEEVQESKPRLASVSSYVPNTNGLDAETLLKVLENRNDSIGNDLINYADLNFNRGVKFTSVSSLESLTNQDIQKLNNKSLDSVKSTMTDLDHVLSTRNSFYDNDNSSVDVSQISSELSIASLTAGLSESVPTFSQFSNFMAGISDLALVERDSVALNDYRNGLKNLQMSVSTESNQKVRSLSLVAQEIREMTSRARLPNDRIATFVSQLASTAGNDASMISTSASLSSSCASASAFSVSQSRAAAAAQSASQSIKNSNSYSRSASVSRNSANRDHDSINSTNANQAAFASSSSQRVVKPYQGFMNNSKMNQQLIQKLAESGLSRSDSEKMNRLISKGISVTVARRCVDLEEAPQIPFFPDGFYQINTFFIFRVTLRFLDF